MMSLILFSFLAGIVTILSPCILPVLPPLLAAGALGGKRRPLGIVIGFAASFTFFTLFLSWLVQLFGISPNILQMAAVVIIGLFGLTLLIPKLGDVFERFTQKASEVNVEQRAGFTGGLLMGAALGLVWTPCAGPILAAIITLAVTSQVTSTVVWMTLAYSIGAALPMLLVIYGGKAILAKFKNHTQTIRKVFGALMILAALAIYFELPVYIQQFAAQYIPPIEIENQPGVKDELARLRKDQDKSSALVPGGPVIMTSGGWINSPPLKLEDLKGKVVLVDFWTYSCINCIRTFPELRKLWDKYKTDNFVLIGVHTPEFQFEKDYNNVERATKRFELTYPVVLDNDYMTWRSFNNLYWPAHYLFDKEGKIVYTHFGEGKYLETENAVRKALGLAPLEGEEKAQVRKAVTPETYLGYERADAYSVPISKNEMHLYTGQIPGTNQVSLEGEWKVDKESVTSGKGAVMRLMFQASSVYLVLSGNSNEPVKIFLNGQPYTLKTDDMQKPGEILVKEARKYDVVKVPYGDYLLELRFPEGIQAYAFTFGVNE